jgi:hypothetical protein
MDDLPRDKIEQLRFLGWTVNNNKAERPQEMRKDNIIIEGDHFETNMELLKLEKCR